jgi:malonyl CoA-acyl carrier protein transacylase
MNVLDAIQAVITGNREELKALAEQLESIQERMAVLAVELTEAERVAQISRPA